MGYALVTPPASEPLTRQEVKIFLGVGSVDGSGAHPADGMIDSLIVAARRFAEQETQSSLISQVWKLTLDAFPGYRVGYSPWAREFSIPESAIVLTKGPVTAIGSVSYVDYNGVTQTAPSTDYVADLSGKLALITPVFGRVWPIALPQIGSVSVQFTAGRADAAAVPDDIKTWMKLRIRDLWDNRGAMVASTLMPNPYIDSMLDAHRIMVA